MLPHPVEPALVVKSHSRRRGPMKYIVEAKDPHEILVRLARGTWQYHITVEHPEIQGPDDIQKVIERPQIIIVDQSDEETHHFYAQGLHPFPKLYLHVVVAYRGSGDEAVGKVLTAFFVKMPVKGEFRWVNIKRSL